jgi:general secretion pathway protein M
MSATTFIGHFKDQLALYWLARTEQERKYLTVGGATVVGAVVYMLLIGPALDGKAKLNKQLPQMRVEAATMQALAQEATELASRPAPAVSPMTRESLTAALTARAMTPASLVITGEFAKIQLTGVSFANLYSWLDAQRRENRIGVEDMTVTAGSPDGQVDAQLTLRQNSGEASR